MLYAMLPKLKEFHHWVRTKAQKEGLSGTPGLETSALLLRRVQHGREDGKGEVWQRC
jgi:hypothetical protein